MPHTNLFAKFSHACLVPTSVGAGKGRLRRAGPGSRAACRREADLEEERRIAVYLKEKERKEQEIQQEQVCRPSPSCHAEGRLRCPVATVCLKWKPHENLGVAQQRLATTWSTFFWSVFF